MLKLYKVRYLFQRQYLTGGDILRNMIAISTLCSLVIGLLLIAGCGGSSEASIDKAAFVKEANTICEQVSGKLAAEMTTAIKESYSMPVNKRAETSVIVTKQSLIPGFETELEEIRALGMPSEGQKEVQAFFGEMQKMIAAGKANPEAFASSSNPYEAAELAGRRYGVSACPIASVSSE